ncbi:MAG: shikimate kinase [Vicinamibacterales bacterium]
MNADKIYLVGFMGAGKSTVARALGRRLGWRVFDIDDLVEQRERQTVAELFARRGEAYFRAAEQAVLLDLVALRHAVVATGGGTFVNAQNRAVMLEDGLAVWLDLPLEGLIARVPVDGRRPLAADRVEFERLYAARRPAYEQAHVRIDAQRATVASIVEQVVDRLDKVGQ